jgi:dihydroorotate dehydrogenase (fumarate)
MLNTEGWSDLTAEQWIEEELPSLGERDGVVIASTGHTPGEVGRLAGPLAETGVDMLELVSYDQHDAAPMVEAAKRAAPIPILIKVSANWNSLREVVAACVEAGADGITAIDSIGQALAIDVETGRPLLGSFAWLSGEAIRPVALRVVAQISLDHTVPLVGTGGIGTAEQALETLMAGATAVGVHTAPLLQGLAWFGRAVRELRRWLDERGCGQIAALRGRALPYLRRPTSRGSLVFMFDAGTCTACGRCVTVCAYGARELSSAGSMMVDGALCRSCGLCVSVCPTGALGVE